MGKIITLQIPHGIVGGVFVHVGETPIIKAGIDKHPGRRAHGHSHKAAGDQLAGILADHMHSNQTFIGNCK